MAIYDKKYDLLVFGESMVQYTVESKDITTEKLQNPSVGGEGVFVAAEMAKHGFTSGIYSVIAKDPYENLIRNGLKKYNINTDNCISGIGYNGIEIVCDADNEAREFFYNRPPGFVGPIISPVVNKELIDQCRMIYASSSFTFSSDNARSLIFQTFHYAHHSGSFIAFDPNVRLHRHNLPQLRETIWMLMPFIDFFSISMASNDGAEEKGGEMRAIFGIEDPVEVALNLLEKNVRYVAIRNGGENMVFAYRDEDTGKNIYRQIPVEKLDGGYFSYSGAIFNGAFISAILNEMTPEEAAAYAVKRATQKCCLGNTLDAIFPMDD